MGVIIYTCDIGNVLLCLLNQSTVLACNFLFSFTVKYKGQNAQVEI